MVGRGVSDSVATNSVATGMDVAVLSGTLDVGVAGGAVAAGAAERVRTGTSVPVGSARGSEVAVEGGCATVAAAIGPTVFGTAVGATMPCGRRLALAYRPKPSRTARNANKATATTGAGKRRYCAGAGAWSVSCGSFIWGPVCARGVTPADHSDRKSTRPNH